MSMKRKNKWRNVRLSQVGDSGVDNERLNSLLKNLCEEIHLKAMPKAAAEFIKRNIMGLLLEPIWSTIKEFGNYDVFYIEDNKEMPDKQCNSIVFIDPHICLLRQKLSIPLIDFLEYFQEHGPSKIIAECARIPEEKQEYVYRQAVEFIRQQLEENPFSNYSDS